MLGRTESEVVVMVGLRCFELLGYARFRLLQVEGLDIGDNFEDSTSYMVIVGNDHSMRAAGIHQCNSNCGNNRTSLLAMLKNCTSCRNATTVESPSGKQRCTYFRAHREHARTPSFSLGRKWSLLPSY